MLGAKLPAESSSDCPCPGSPAAVEASDSGPAWCSPWGASGRWERLPVVAPPGGHGRLQPPPREFSRSGQVGDFGKGCVDGSVSVTISGQGETPERRENQVAQHGDASGPGTLPGHAHIHAHVPEPCLAVWVLTPGPWLSGTLPLGHWPALATVSLSCHSWQAPCAHGPRGVCMAWLSCADCPRGRDSCLEWP